MELLYDITFCVHETFFFFFFFHFVRPLVPNGKTNNLNFISYSTDSNTNNYYFQAGREKFAFIYESPYLEYKQQISCDNITDLIKVGEEFNKFGWVILHFNIISVRYL